LHSKGRSDRPVIVISVREIERPDGTLAQIRGPYDLEIIMVGGKTITFAHPVHVESDSDSLMVSGGDRAQTRIPIADIRSASVSQYSSWETVALISGISLAAGLATYFVMSSSLKNEAK
jgi:hypothetical protein